MYWSLDEMGITFSTPSGRVSVSLKNNNGGQCYGAIYLNGPQQAVCANTEKIGQLVCGELGCGEFMFKSDVSLSLNWKSMSCPRHAESLWHCQEEEKACEKKAIICSGTDLLVCHSTPWGLLICTSILGVDTACVWMSMEDQQRHV